MKHFEGFRMLKQIYHTSKFTGEVIGIDRDLERVYVEAYGSNGSTSTYTIDLAFFPKRMEVNEGLKVDVEVVIQDKHSIPVMKIKPHVKSINLTL